MLDTGIEYGGGGGTVGTRVAREQPASAAALLRMVPTPGPWQRKAACRALSPSLFFPDEPGEELDQPLAVCARCEVRQPCLEFALATNQLGIWGGTTEDARRAIKRARRRQRAQARAAEARAAAAAVTAGTAASTAATGA